MKAKLLAEVEWRQLQMGNVVVQFVCIHIEREREHFSLVDLKVLHNVFLNVLILTVAL